MNQLEKKDLPRSGSALYNLNHKNDKIRNQPLADPYKTP